MSAQTPTSTRYGTRSPAASASRALPPRRPWPVAQARLTSANAKPWARRPPRRRRSASPSPACRASRSAARRTRSERPAPRPTPATAASAMISPPPATPITLGTSRPRRTRARSAARPTASNAAAKERGRDRRRAGAELVEPQRPEHGDGAEQHAGQGREPHARRAPGGRQRAMIRVSQARVALRLPPPSAAPTHHRHPTTATAPNTGSCPSAPAAAPSTGPNSAGHRGGERGADVLAAALARRGADQPPERPGPRGGAADALDEARDVEHHDAVGEREARCSSHQQAEAEQHGRPARRRAPPSSRREARPRTSSAGYAAAEHARRRLRQAVARR